MISLVAKVAMFVVVPGILLIEFMIRDCRSLGLPHPTHAYMNELSYFIYGSICLC